MVELVREYDGRSVEQLAEELDVSKATVRRDLSQLEADGLVERSHGGAVPATAVGHEQTYRQREVQNLEAKIAIGEHAAEKIHEGDVALFDAGTTTLQVATAAPANNAFVAVTNSPRLGLELTSNAESVTLTGGSLRESSRSLVGPSTTGFLDQRHFDVAFVGTNAVDGDGRLSTPDEAEARVKSLMIERAERVVIVTDASKFGERSFVEFGDIREADTLVTDRRPEGEVADALAKTNVAVDVVSAG